MMCRFADGLTETHSKAIFKKKQKKPKEFIDHLGDANVKKKPHNKNLWGFLILNIYTLNF